MTTKRFIATLTAVLLMGTAVCTAANAATVTVTVKLPNGAPAKGAFVRMFDVRAGSYAIISFETETTDASGRAIFKVPARPDACLKAEYGRDAHGRSLYIGSACKPFGKTVTINLNP